MKNIAIMLLLCLPLLAPAQISRPAYDIVKDTVIARFNRQDFKGIYGLFDTTFRKQVSESAVVRFLKNNQNGGKIMESAFRSEKDRTATYLLKFQVRDMLMNLELDSEGKVSGFGFKNSPPVLLDHAPVVLSDNAKSSALDLAVDSAAQQYFRNPNAASLAIGLIYKGKHIIYHYGETDKGNGRLPGNGTLYEMGSVTKTFTATLLAQAVLDGKVRLSDDIRKYLKGTYQNLEYKGSPITLQDLANHTSRLPAMPPDIGDQPGYDPVYPETHYSQAAFYLALHQVVLDTVPGHKFEYSNWGISVLGHILETIYGQPESVLLKKFVTGPLRMPNTFYEGEAKAAAIALPHADNGSVLKLTDQGYFYPAGGLCSTASDLLNYLQAQLEENMPAVKLTHQPTANNTGLGWGVRAIDRTRDLQHNGSEQGSNANITVYPELQSGCVILANSKANISPLVVRIQQLLKRP